MAELLKLKVNVPELIALQYAKGKIVESTIPDSPNQVMFTLCDGRRTFLPLSAADRIREAGIQPMEQFEIVKASANDFRVRTFSAAGVVRATPAAGGDTTSSRNAQSRNGFHPTPPPPPPPPPEPVPPPPQGLQPTSLRFMGAYKAAIDVLIEARSYAQQNGIALEIRCEDVRCLSATMMIDAQKGGGR